MEESEISVEQIVHVLNEAVKCDPMAMQRLIEHRTPCNKAMADHPTIQVGDGISSFVVGTLGIINAIAAVDGRLIEAAYDDETKRLIRFQIRPKGDA